MARTETSAIAFGVAYLGVKDIFSTDNSSPQTTQLNAKKRAPTLMKWVNIAAVESVALVACLAAASPKGARHWPVLGGLSGLGVTYGMYIHAKNCGMKSNEPGTEDYETFPKAASNSSFAFGNPASRAMAGRMRGVNG